MLLNFLFILVVFVVIRLRFILLLDALEPLILDLLKSLVLFLA